MRTFAALLITAVALQVNTVLAEDFRIHQWRAAKTFYFISHHHSFPIFNLNPVFSSDVVNINNQTVVARGALCFPKLAKDHKTRYRQLDSLGSRVTLAAEAAFGAQGRVTRVINLGADIDIELADTATFEVDPISVDSLKLGISSLRTHVNMDKPECEEARRAIRGGLRDHIIAANVLHGSVKLQTQFKLKAGAGASVDSGIPIKVAGPFEVEAGSLDLSIYLDEQLIAGIGKEKTQAITPAYIGREQIARIAYYLEGERGADLEIAVREAIEAKEVGPFRELAIRAKQIINQVEFDYGSLFVGDHLIAASEIDNKSYEKLAIGVAAVELRRYVESLPTETADRSSTLTLSIRDLDQVFNR